MLIKDKDSMEGLYHVCDNADRFNEYWHTHTLKVFVHDMSSRLETFGSNGKRIMATVVYCPYCGQKIADDRYATAAETEKYSKWYFSGRDYPEKLW